jgi:hypothetical protein
MVIDGVKINNFYTTQGVSLDGTEWQFTNADALGIQEGSLVPIASDEITPQALPLVALAGAGTGVGALAVLGAVGLASVAGNGGAGVTGVNADNLAAVTAQGLKQAPGDANSPSEVPALVTLANAAIARIEAYNNGNGTSPPSAHLG